MAYTVCLGFGGWFAPDVVGTRLQPRLPRMQRQIHLRCDVSADHMRHRLTHENRGGRLSHEEAERLALVYERRMVGCHVDELMGVYFEDRPKHSLQIIGDSIDVLDRPCTNQSATGKLNEHKTHRELPVCRCGSVQTRVPSSRAHVQGGETTR